MLSPILKFAQRLPLDAKPYRSLPPNNIPHITIVGRSRLRVCLTPSQDCYNRIFALPKDFADWRKAQSPMSTLRQSFLLLGFLATQFASPKTQAATQLQGAGATFPAPLYQRWIAEYAKNTPDIQINYQAVGSGAGI